MMGRHCDKSNVSQRRKKREKDKKRNGLSDKSSSWLKGGSNKIMNKEKNEKNHPLGAGNRDRRQRGKNKYKFVKRKNI